MRALLMMSLLVPLASGCNSAAPDPCKGVAGTCVSMTVQSSTVATVDSLHILASGALTGDQTSSGGRANLPLVVALKLPANTSGSLDLHVDAFLTAQLVGYRGKRGYYGHVDAAALKCLDQRTKIAITGKQD